MSPRRFIRVPARERAQDAMQLPLLPEPQKPARRHPGRQGGRSEGLLRKRRELTGLQWQHKARLEALRVQLADLYRRRVRVLLEDEHYVTADDAVVIHEELERGSPMPVTGPRVWLGSLFKSKEWEFTGRWVTSSRPENNGRQQRCWRLKREVT